LFYTYVNYLVLLQQIWFRGLTLAKIITDETSMIVKSHLYAVAHQCEGIQEYD